jgi:hypothetical protein
MTGGRILGGEGRAAAVKAFREDSLMLGPLFLVEPTVSQLWIEAAKKVAGMIEDLSPIEV